MHGNELILNWAKSNAKQMNKLVAEMPGDLLVWRADDQANCISDIVWHVSRWLDILVNQALLNKPADQEFWVTAGWQEKTGYTPAGKGWRQFGSMTGYTFEEVLEIPALSAADLLAYYNECSNALVAYLETLPADGLSQPPAGWGGNARTTYYWVETMLMDGSRHIGEITFIQGVWRRANGLPNIGF